MNGSALCSLTLCVLLASGSSSFAGDEKLPPPRRVETPATITVPMALPSASSQPILHSGENVTLRIRQVIPADGFCPAERLLNGRPGLQAGDQFLAEVVAPPGQPTTLVWGSVTQVSPPRSFGRPGRVTLELGQLLRMDDGNKEGGWRLELVNQRFTSAQRRRLVTTLFALEGLGVGASVGAQLAQGNIGYIGGGAGIGLLCGVAYASLQAGREPSLEPGDTFRVTVGLVCADTLPPSDRLRLYPAPDPNKGKGKP